MRVAIVPLDSTEAFQRSEVRRPTFLG